MQGRIHSLESFGTVDGPGTRFVVFVQGCPMRCAYCHNPDTWEMNGGTLMEPSYIIEQYEKNKAFYANGGGLTVTGGEPLTQNKPDRNPLHPAILSDRPYILLPQPPDKS
ncbi:MAG: 4Fe-4S cluster-binding domain-containing protein, partial [Lachnospiraceae bacterium]|nr:4Fe-4S cluster-binding domain-containing protein [Lachnospiraceae bacterium]